MVENFKWIIDVSPGNICLSEWREHIARRFPFLFMLRDMTAQTTTDLAYVEMEQWCLENFSGDFCLFLNAVRCSNEFDVMAFKLMWG